MVAFRAKVDGTWQAKFQRRLRYRVTGLRPSGFPNLPFSLFLPFLPFSSASLSFFPIFAPFFPSFHTFHSSLFFFFFFRNFRTFPSPSLILCDFPRFLVKATRLHVSPLPAMCPTRHRIMRPTRHVVKEDFCLFLCILGTFKKRVLLQVKKMRMKKMMRNDSPVSKVSLRSMTIQMMNLTNLVPQSERSSPYCILSESRF